MTQSSFFLGRELDETGSVASRIGYRLSGCVARFVTDFLITEHYYIVLQVWGGMIKLYSRYEGTFRMVCRT